MIYVFDLDGTLIDSTFRHGFLMERLLSKEGITVEEDFQERYMRLKRDGMSSKTVLRDAYGLNPDLVNKVVKKWVEQIESDEMLALDKLYDDSIETLERIKETGSQIYYLSLRQRKDAAICELKRLGIYDFAEEVYIGKPSEGVEYKVEKLRRLKMMDEVLMIGDTEIDYEASETSKALYYLLNRGFRSRSYFERSHVLTKDTLHDLKHFHMDYRGLL